jgi:uncharacterized membrane protein
MLIIFIIILLIVLFGGGFGYWGHSTYGSSYPWAGGGIGLGTILIILLVCYLLGAFR